VAHEVAAMDESLATETPSSEERLKLEKQIHKLMAQRIAER